MIFNYCIRLIATPEVLFFKMSFRVGTGVHSNNPSKSGLFDPKEGVYSRKTPKTELFTLIGSLFKSRVAINWIRYVKMLSCILS